MIAISASNINEIQLSLYDYLKSKGMEVCVRGSKTLEIYPVTIELKNPRNRVTTLKYRNWNLPFAIGESCWHFAGSNDSNFITYYSQNWQLALEDNETVIRESCYGSNIFKGQDSLWNKLKFELIEDMSSRRAVISLYDSKSSLGNNLKDVACTSTIQFLVRKNQLDCIVSMRSNDVIWGLPNDIFFFTFLQERLAVELGIELGTYFHNVASLHVYERHFELLKNISNTSDYFDFEMPIMNSVNCINQFLEGEANLRKGLPCLYTNNEYWDDLLDVLKLRSQVTELEEKRNIISNSRYKKVIDLCKSSYLEPINIY